MTNTMSSLPTLSQAQLESIEHEAKSKGVLKEYRAMVRKGESPRMAIMLAVQRFPGLKGTDTQFQKLERERVNHDYEDKDMAKIHQLAKKAGIATAGKTYNGQLGRYDDPRAWVSDTSDVVAAAKEKGLSLRGQVNVENEAKPMKKTRLAKRLIDQAERQMIKADPALAEKVRKKPSVRKELRERIIDKHGVKPNPQ